MCLLDRVRVREVLSKRGINCTTTFSVCNSGNESIIHNLKDYRFAKSFCDRMVFPEFVLKIKQTLITCMDGGEVEGIRVEGGKVKLPYFDVF